MVRKQLSMFLAVVLLSNVTTASADDPWTLREGEIVTFAGYLFETADTFFRASSHAQLPFDGFDQQTWSVGLNYGVTDDLTLDLALGYTKTNGNAALGDEEGLNDSTIGLRYRVIDEFAHDTAFVPSVALGIKGIIAGSYDDDGFPIAPGDGAHGVALSMLWGKVFGDSGLGTYGEVGLRLREEEVPEDLFINAGIYQQLFEHFSLSAEYRRDQALSGIDLGAPDFAPDRARELKQISDNFEFGFGYTHDSGFYVGVLYGLTASGRNTLEKDIYGVSVSAPL